jgi:hypothetical protein
MTGRAGAFAAVFASAVAAFVVAASVASATRAGAICPAFSKGGLKYQWETVGTGFTCKSAKPWVVRLSSDRVKSIAGRVPLHNGPAHFHCFATGDLKGHASGGLCYKNTLAYPGSGFTWNGS